MQFARGFTAGTNAVLKNDLFQKETEFWCENPQNDVVKVSYEFSSYKKFK